MWARNLAYDKALALVKAHRTVASPNMAFQAALLRWEQMRCGKLAPAVTPAQSAELWLYRICRHHASKGNGMLIAKQVVLSKPAASAGEGADAADIPGLDPRGCFILRAAGAKLYGWVGKEVADADPCRTELPRALTRMRKFECPADADTAAPAATTKPEADGQTLLPPKTVHSGGKMAVDTKQAAEAPDSATLPLPGAEGGSTKAPATKSPVLVLEQGAEPSEIARLIVQSAGGFPCHRKQFDASYRAVAKVETKATSPVEAELAAETLALLPTAESEKETMAPLTARGQPPPRSETLLSGSQGSSSEARGKLEGCGSAGDDDGANLIPSSKKTKPSAPSTRPVYAVPTAAPPGGKKTVVPSASPRHQTPRINPETADPVELAAMLSMATPRAQQVTAAAAVDVPATGNSSNQAASDGKGGTRLYHQVDSPGAQGDTKNHGKWERFDNYDEDDLWPERLFVICVEDTPSWYVPSSPALCLLLGRLITREMMVSVCMHAVRCWQFM
jgi:hypothetical protein